MLFSKSSLINERLYDLGLINDSFGYEYAIDKNYSYFIISGESKNAEEVKKVIISELNNIKSIETKDFQRVKKVLIGNFISRFNSIDGLGYTLNDFFARDINFFDYYDVLKEISIEEIEITIKDLFKDESCVLSIVD